MYEGSPVKFNAHANPRMGQNGRNKKSRIKKSGQSLLFSKKNQPPVKIFKMSFPITNTIRTNKIAIPTF